MSPLNGELKIIDYEKLKLAHELINKTDNYFLRFIVQEHLKDGCNEYAVVHRIYEEEYWYVNIDSLIIKLQELTQPKSKPKYKQWQEVYYLTDGGIDWAKVHEVDTNYHPYLYRLEMCGEWVEENRLYPSEQALIDAQIEYWQSMKKQSVEKNEMVCEHESDTYTYITEHKPQKHSKKCKKCGEFY